MQQSCPPLPRKSGRLGLVASLNRRQCRRILITSKNICALPFQMIVSTQCEIYLEFLPWCKNLSGFLVLLLVSWTWALGMNLQRNMTSFIVLPLLHTELLSLQMPSCSKWSIKKSSLACWSLGQLLFLLPITVVLPSICSCFCQLQSPLMQLLI